MDKFQKFCVFLLKFFIAIGLILIFIGTIFRFSPIEKNSLSIEMIVIFFSTLIGGCILINLNLSTKIKVFILLLATFFIRIWWILNVKSIPVSDFEKMYMCANDFLNGNLFEFRNFGYLSRFPHLIPMTVYMAFMIILFPTTHLFVMKIINAVLAVITSFFLYKLSSHFIKHEKIRLGILIISAIFPAFISYSSTFCTENIAIPLYLATMLLFLNDRKITAKHFICGILLGISDLFRGVGIVFLIAFLIYTFVFTDKNKLKNSLMLGLGMVGVTLFVSIFLISIQITDKPLFKGAEPSFATLLLKGSNIENGGRWNLEDADFVEANLDNPVLVKKCFEIAIDRISSLSNTEKINFFKNKFISQWSIGDFSGTYWAFNGTDRMLNGDVPIVFQLIYIGLIFLSGVSLIDKKIDKKTALIYILFVGFGLLFMIIETQSRYSYIISWAFIILSSLGIEVFFDKVLTKMFSYDRINRKIVK